MKGKSALRSSFDTWLIFISESFRLKLEWLFDEFLCRVSPPGARNNGEEGYELWVLQIVFRIILQTLTTVGISEAFLGNSPRELVKFPIAKVACFGRSVNWGVARKYGRSAKRTSPLSSYPIFFRVSSKIIWNYFQLFQIKAMKS